MVPVSQESQKNREYETAISYCCRTEVIPVWAFYSSTKLQFRTTVDETIPFEGLLKSFFLLVPRVVQVVLGRERATEGSPSMDHPMTIHGSSNDYPWIIQ